MSMLKKAADFAKGKTLFFMVLVGLVTLTISNLILYGVLYNISMDLNNARQDLSSLQADYTRDITNIGDNIGDIKDNAKIKFGSLQSKFEILDSAIKPDEKRRMLIKTVRDSIQAYTDRKLDIRTLNRIAIAVVDNSYTYNLTIAQVLAQMAAESDFDPKAQSHAGAKGLMQLVDSTADAMAEQLGKKRYNIWDINTNIEFGCLYMSQMLDHYDHDYTYALRGYNFGPHNVDQVKVGDADYSSIREVEEDGRIAQYLVGRQGHFLLDDDGNRIKITEDVPEQYRYPIETQRYTKFIHKTRLVFAEYGLDKVE